MEGELVLRYERSPDFFRFLEFQSDDHAVFLGETESGELKAVATVSVRAGFIGGRETRVGYLGDLRVAFDRRLLRSWRGFYAELLARSEELLGCRELLTAVIDDNARARAALAENRREDFTYAPLARYRMVNLVARTPLAWRRTARPTRRGSRDPVEIARASASDLAELEAFLLAQNTNRAFGLARGELARRLRAWPGLEPRSFLLARAGGKIVGCFGAWSPSPAKRIVVEKMPARLRALARAVALTGRPAPVPGRELKIAYLTMLEIARERTLDERRRIFRLLLDAGYREGAFIGSHLVAFADFESSTLRPALAGYLTQTTPMTLFRVLAAGRPAEPAALGELPPAFEMALV